VTDPLLHLIQSTQEPYLLEAASTELHVGDSKVFVMCHPNQRWNQKKAASFGFLHLGSASDHAVLFEKVESWATRQGAEILYGPINYSTFFDYRLRLDDFKRPPFRGEPYNSNQDVDALLRVNFVQDLLFESCFLDDKEALRTMITKNSEHIDGIEKKLNFTLQPLSFDLWKEMLPSFHRVTNEIFKDNAAFVPISMDLFKRVFNEQFFSQVCLKSSLMAMDPAGNLVGYCLNFSSPENSKTLLIKTAGFLPQARNMGLSFIYLLFQSLSRALPDYNSFVFCLMKKGNFPSLLSSDLNLRTTNYALFSKRLLAG